MMTNPTPGVYPGLSRAEYDAIPALRSTVAYRMLSTAPAKAVVDIESTDAMDLGTCCHELMLEGEERFAASPYSDYRKKEAREWKADQEAKGVIPMKQEDMEKVRAIVRSGRDQIGNLEEDWHFNGGESELSVVWDDPLGVRCKARLDWTDLSHITDYKTSKGATPSSWIRRMLPAGPAFSASFYLRGMSVLYPDAKYEWRWIVQDTESPYLLFCVGLIPEAKEIADRQVEHAIKMAKACEDAGWYPGYSKYTYWGDLPPYVKADLDEKEAMDDMEGMMT